MKNMLRKNAITILITLAAAGSIAAVVAYNSSQMAHATQVSVEKSTSRVEINEDAIIALPKVTVQNTQAASYQAEVVGYGETKARYELDYVSEVSGRVEWLSDAFEAGATIKQGTLLAKIDTTSYEQAVAQAKSDLVAAKLELLEEQRQGEQARSEWTRSGLAGEPNSALVLREPQLASVKAKQDNAEKSLKRAQDDLKNTQIRAPFDGVIVSRDIQPGSYLNVGSSVATLYSTDRIEIEIPLSNEQWENLPQLTDMLQWTATIRDSAGRYQWNAQIDRGFQYVAQETRQRSIILVIDKPLELEQPLFSGTFVQANILGTEVDNLWKLPASALSQQGEVWTVDQQGLLAKSSAKTVFERKQNIYVVPTEQAESVLVVLRPLSNFKVGMKVSPQFQQAVPTTVEVASMTLSELGED